MRDLDPIFIEKRVNEVEKNLAGLQFRINNGVAEYKKPNEEEWHPFSGGGNNDIKEIIVIAHPTSLLFIKGNDTTILPYTGNYENYAEMLTENSEYLTMYFDSETYSHIDVKKDCKIFSVINEAGIATDFIERENGYKFTRFGAIQGFLVIMLIKE